MKSKSSVPIKPLILLLMTITAVITILTISCAEYSFPASYALVYAVADYGDPLDDLRFTDDDADAFAFLLSQNGWNVEKRIDQEATLAQLTADVTAIASVIPDDGRFLFYFSGHGTQIVLDGTEPNSAAEEGDELILLYDSLATLRSYYAGTSSLSDVFNVTVSDDSLAGILSSVGASNRMIIIDACLSGGFIGDGFTFDALPADYTEGEPSSAKRDSRDS